ncbi:tetratricopeptide repeat protein [Candidatus Nomurabacteria bacterium]|nr:tetratricopeptide repeat protein [Candidatus Saccharibacteria bacterium]MCB9839805.1 tetratricopeptide repeat protein [Candidatus Nomurabacteria bacterium]
MTGLLLIILITIITLRSTYKLEDLSTDIPDKIANRLGKLWEIAHQGMKENKLLRAEKALLTILKIDEKNAAAYNRLGILYAKQKDFKNAIDCFEIASSIEKSSSSFHNLGLIYYETGDYVKASIAFEEALSLEDGMAARHIAYAKVQEKLGNNKKMISELEKSAELEPTRETYSLLKRAYEIHGMDEEAKIISRKLNRAAKSNKPKRITRPKKVVV